MTMTTTPTPRPKAGERFVKEMNRLEITTWAVYEWKILRQVGPLESCLVAGGLSKADADLLAHGLERIAELEAALADMFAALDRYGRQIDDLFGHDEQFIAAEDAARAALTRKEESR